MKACLRFMAAMAVVALAIGATAIPALADQALDDAKIKFDTAQADYAVKNYSKAAQGFLDAYALRGDIPVMLFNAAVAFEEQAKVAGSVADYESAIANYTAYIAANPADPDNVNTAKRVTALAAEVVTLKANPPPAGTAASAAVTGLVAVDVVKGVYIIESNPKNAKIFLNSVTGEPFATTPWSGTLVGTPTLIITLDGYVPHTAILPTSPNGLVVKSIDLAQIGEKPYLTVIASNVAGANVSIFDENDKEIVRGNTPFGQSVPAGRVTIKVSADGFDEVTRQVTLINGKSEMVEATLVGAPVGYLNMRGDGIEESQVYIDGKLECDPGPCKRPLREGAHTVRVTRSGYKPFEKRVEINAKAETSIKIDLAEKPAKWDAVIAYGLAAAFTGGGVYLGLQANKLRDELAADIVAGNPPVDVNDSRFTRGKVFAIAADAAYGVAAITFLTAIYYTFRDKGPASRGAVDTKTLAISPTVGASYAGLDMAVSW